MTSRAWKVRRWLPVAQARRVELRTPGPPRRSAAHTKERARLALLERTAPTTLWRARARARTLVARPPAAGAARRRAVTTPAAAREKQVKVAYISARFARFTASRWQRRAAQAALTRDPVSRCN